jgi:anti-anti-sigma factor
MEQLATELTGNIDNVWTLKIIGSVVPPAHQSMWSVDSSAALLEKLRQVRAKKLLIDLEQAERFDSHGLRLLLNAQKEFSKVGIPIVLRNPNSHLNRLFQIMQFDRAFEIEFTD